MHKRYVPTTYPLLQLHQKLPMVLWQISATGWHVCVPRKHSLTSSHMLVLVGIFARPLLHTHSKLPIAEEMR